MFPSVLVVDDEPSIVQSLEGLLSDEGFDVMTASNGYEALKIIEAELPDIVLLDIWMPGIDGIETLKEIKETSPHIAVIMITGHGTIETAVSATKLGAFDFIEKPLSIDKVIVGINNALNFRRLEEENRYLRKKALSQSSIDGSSPPINALKQQITDAAPSNAWILITGENGTGKEMAARTIHTLSPRAEQQFVDVNCAAIPEASIDSELFGHEKGAFKEAASKSIGKIELANNGTLFLDEISDMNLKTQAKLLRALQEQKIQRIGSNRPVSVDVRVIAATNKDLEAEIEAGRFREDFYYRLNVIPIHVPPLRGRKQDIPVLADIFLKNQTRQNKTEEKQFSPEALDLLCTYPWPGNVRELKNLTERLAIMVKKETIEVADLPGPYNPHKAKASDPVETRLFSAPNLKEARTEFENTFIKIKLLQNDNNVTQTARAIGVDRSYLHKKLKKIS
ncbi:MAG: sigma-54 dependent transcriptional regulator [Thermodesulfobacteriota bacterium]|nr:sigma-54 dependent transcriptional regulator [Thermodesulfobacteriota bacterium]